MNDSKVEAGQEQERHYRDKINADEDMNATSEAEKPKLPISYMETRAAYDLWAEVYDTDGNFLQVLDTIQMETLMPAFMEIPLAAGSDETHETPKTLPTWKVVDFGCGTGRTTMRLLLYPQALVYGLDVSEQMMNVAKSKVEAAKLLHRCKFLPYDAMDPTEISHELSAELQGGVDSVVSSLVVEHLPLEIFFESVDIVLKQYGTLLVTNMHPEMGALSQAGFIKGGTKIRPRSYAHEIVDVLEAASQMGFRLVGDVREESVTDEMVEKLGIRAKKWVGVKVWFGMIFQKT